MDLERIIDESEHTAKNLFVNYENTIRGELALLPSEKHKDHLMQLHEQELKLFTKNARYYDVRDRTVLRRHISMVKVSILKENHPFPFDPLTGKFTDRIARLKHIIWTNYISLFRIKCLLELIENLGKKEGVQKKETKTPIIYLPHNSKIEWLLFKFLKDFHFLRKDITDGEINSCFEVLTGYSGKQLSKVWSAKNLETKEDITENDYDRLVEELKKVIEELEQTKANKQKFKQFK